VTDPLGVPTNVARLGKTNADEIGIALIMASVVF
jgi:hypothetical protein